MSTIFALFLFFCVGYSDDNAVASKLCNQWEVGSDLSMKTYLKQFHSTSIGQYILQNRNNTMYQNTNWYLPQILVDYHLSNFRLSGASFIGPSQMLYDSNYGHLSFIGKSRQIVTTYPEMQALLKNCSKTSDAQQCLLTHLDMNEDNSPFNNNQVMLYNVNETYLEFLNLRMANNTKNIGGYTMKGISEAMIDHFNSPMFCYEPITDRNGSFCYPDCDEVICGQNQHCTDSYCPNYKVDTTDAKYKFYFDFINDNKYCIPTENITIKSGSTETKCDDEKNGFMDKYFNYGTLAGFVICFIAVLIVWAIARAAGLRCTKVKSTFISDQLLRDDDQYLL